jgi:hypothetical protein
LSAFEGEEIVAPGLYIATLNNLKLSPTRPPDWNTHHLIAGYLDTRASPRLPRVYSGPNQVESTRTPKSTRTSQSSVYSSPNRIESTRTPKSTRTSQSSVYSGPNRIESTRTPKSTHTSQPSVYSGPNRIKSTRTPKSTRTSQLSIGSNIGSFNAPVLRTSERARLRKHHDEPSTPHRVASSRKSFSPTSLSTRGTSVRSSIASPPRPQTLMSPQIVKSSPAAPRTAPQLRSKQETPPRKPKSVNRLTQQRKVSAVYPCCGTLFYWW